MEPLDLTGKTFGSLTVEHLIRDGYKPLWMCKCACGRQSPSIQQKLIDGNKTVCESCMKKGSACNYKHGLRHTSEYNTWTGMKARCLHVNNPKYKNYGGRGIRVCDRWAQSFQFFIDDVGMKPGLEYTLGRIDNDGDYEPGNCRWETAKEQASNRRKAPPRPSHPNSLKALCDNRFSCLGRTFPKKSPPKICSTCAKEFYGARKDYHQSVYCSRECYVKGREWNGASNPNWKHGEYSTVPK